MRHRPTPLSRRLLVLLVAMGTPAVVSMSPLPMTGPAVAAKAPRAVAAQPQRAVAAQPPDAIAAPPPAAAHAAPRPRYPGVVVIGHRGAPAYRPQHTLQSYQLAIDQGADFIELDLVSTKDGALIARHERDLTDTTDIRHLPKLAGLARNGRWYAEDLTLAQVKTLRATGGPAAHSGRYRIPTLKEAIALVKLQRRKIGMYAEIKDPAYLRGIGLPVEERLARALRSAGWTRRGAPVVIESFEPASLRRMHQLVNVRLLLLLWGGTGAGPVRVAEVNAAAGYADGIGVDHGRLRDYLEVPPPDTENLIILARQRGLGVHVYTFGLVNPYGPIARHAHPADPVRWKGVIPLYRAYYALGVAAVFSDAPDIATYARG